MAKFNKEMEQYLIEFMYDGKKWGFSLYAKDWEDAEEKLWAMQDNAVVVGKLVETIYEH